MDIRGAQITIVGGKVSECQIDTIYSLFGYKGSCWKCCFDEVLLTNDGRSWRDTWDMKMLICTAYSSCRFDLLALSNVADFRSRSVGSMAYHYALNAFRPCCGTQAITQGAPLFNTVSKIKLSYLLSRSAAESHLRANKLYENNNHTNNRHGRDNSTCCPYLTPHDSKTLMTSLVRSITF